MPRLRPALGAIYCSVLLWCSTGDCLSGPVEAHLRATLASCQPQLRIAEHRSGLPLADLAARCVDRLADLEEGKTTAGAREDCPGSRVLRALLADCLLAERRKLLYTRANNQERLIIGSLTHAGYAKFRGLDLIAPSNLTKVSEGRWEVDPVSASYPEYARTVRDCHGAGTALLQRVGGLLDRLHGQLQPIRITAQQLEDETVGNSDDFFQELHFDGLTPTFRGYYYSRATCTAQGVISVVPGSHALSAARLWWLHQLGGDDPGVCSAHAWL